MARLSRNEPHCHLTLAQNRPDGRMARASSLPRRDFLFPLTFISMNKTTVIGVIIAIAVLGGIIWTARPNPGNNIASVPLSSARTLKAEETNFDFGQISMAAGKVKHAFKIENTASESVVIEKMYPSCMCTEALLMTDGKQFGPYGMPGHGFAPKINGTINPGEEATVEVVFDPAAHGPAGVGRIGRVVYLENSAGEALELGFTALVTP